MRNIILSFILTITIGCVTFCTSSKDPARSPAKAKRNIAIEKAREATKYGPFEPTEDASRLGDSIYRDHKHASDYVAFKDIVLHRPADVAPTPLILRLLDYYNSKRIIDGAYDNIEKWVRYSEDSILANLPKSINRDYDISIIQSPKTRRLVRKHLHTKKAMDWSEYIIRSISIDSIIRASYDDLQNRGNEKEMAEKYDFNNYVKDYSSLNLAERRSYISLDSANWLRHMATSASDPNAQLIYMIEYAHVVYTGLHPCTALLRDFIESGTYSIYLPEAWRFWRCLMFEAYCGLSTFSYIPNGPFNKMRATCAATILRHIAKHPDDDLAIKQFMLLGSYHDYIRFGPFLYGNQSLLDEMNLYKERYE